MQFLGWCVLSFYAEEGELDDDRSVESTTFQSFIGHSSSGVCAYSCVKQKRSVDGENGGGRCFTG